jgi:seryl-tRNA(Sec) selenium transferase
LEFAGLTTSALEERLRRSSPPVIVRVDDGRVVLDFRTISVREEEELLTILKQKGE